MGVLTLLGTGCHADGHGGTVHALGCDASLPDLPVADADSVANPVVLRPPFPREAVDHTVTYASWRGWGPKGGDRAVLKRHGALVRLETWYIGSRREFEADHETSYANIATGGSIEVRTDSTGALSGVTLWRNGSADVAKYRHSAQRTGVAESIQGERCQVWEGGHESSEVAYSACITSDGIVLRDTVHYRDGDVMEEQRAVKVERRSVDLSEVIPPRDALDWAHWSEFHDPAPAPAATTARPENYQLLLASKDDGSTQAGGTTLYRAAGGWTAKEECGHAGDRSLQLAASDANLTYFGEREGRVQLSLSRRRPRSSAVPGPWPTKPLSMPAAQVLGETCTWVDAAVGVHDYNRNECRTRDNLPLIVTESSWGSSSGRMEAIALSRGRTPDRSLLPPAWLMDWAYWGWPELASRQR